MFKLLNKEIKEYQVLNNKNPEIFMGAKTHETLGQLYVKDGYSYLPLDMLEQKGLVNMYKGIKVNKAEFEYGYYLK